MVSPYSPRHHGETATLFSRPHSKSPSSRHRLLHHSPSSCSTSFHISLSPSTKTRAASRRTTPIKSRSSPVHSPSPIKYPLHLTSTSDMNTSVTGVRTRSSSPRCSPQQQQDDATPPDGFDGGGSLKRSDQIMNFEEVSRGSPVPKRRSAAFGLYSTPNSKPIFGSPSLGFTPATSGSPKRNGSLKKSASNTFFGGDKPSFVRARQVRQNESVASDAAARIRRVTSVENFIPPQSRESPFNTRNAPLPNASSHPAFALQDPSQLAANVSQVSESTSSNWVTPQNYKFAKPNPLAFHSTGFVPKRGRLLGGDKPQPDTPCKRSNQFATPSAANRIPIRDFGRPPTPTGDGHGDLGSILRGRSRRDSFDDGDGYGSRSQSSADFDLPPTPTKKSNLTPIFNGNKRPRTDSSATRGRSHGRLPQTPKDNIVPPDPSSLSISGKSYNPLAKRHTIPATPIREFALPRESPPPVFEDTLATLEGRSRPEEDVLWSRFTDIKLVGRGEFSDVYKVTEKRPTQLSTPDNSSTSGFSSPVATDFNAQVFAVKKARQRFHGPMDRSRKMEEVNILRALGRHEHIVELIDDWVTDGTLYIQTEYCENGSLEKFLEQHGNKGRLDEFRVWKVMLELCMGIQYMHESGFLHLDIKPANIFITFAGSLKIGDFGMATGYPASPDLEREGDREYIAPEVLQLQKYDKPVDIFSLGLTMIEAAGNEALPGNGPEWQRLRSGDITVAPTLSTSSSGEFVYRDEEGNPIRTKLVGSTPPSSPPHYEESESQADVSPFRQQPHRLLHVPRPGDLVEPPSFMAERGLEKIVQMMINPDPSLRPTASQLLEMEELAWVEKRRRSPATIFEGLWGPSDSFFQLPHEDEFDLCSRVSALEQVIDEDYEMEL